MLCSSGSIVLRQVSRHQFGTNLRQGHERRHARVSQEGDGPCNMMKDEQGKACGARPTRIMANDVLRELVDISRCAA